MTWNMRLVFEFLGSMLAIAFGALACAAFVFSIVGDKEKV